MEPNELCGLLKMTLWVTLQEKTGKINSQPRWKNMIPTHLNEQKSQSATVKGIYRDLYHVSLLQWTPQWCIICSCFCRNRSHLINSFLHNSVFGETTLQNVVGIYSRVLWHFLDKRHVFTTSFCKNTFCRVRLLNEGSRTEETIFHMTVVITTHNRKSSKVKVGFNNFTFIDLLTQVSLHL